MDDTNVAARRALNRAAAAWLSIVCLGQWIFGFYVVAHYGRAGVLGYFPEATAATLPHGHEAGNAIGNAFLATHLALAVVIMLGGPLQLVPRVRSRFPMFHRYNGRVYAATALVMSLSGLYLGLSGRRVVGDFTQHGAITINGILILWFVGMAVRSAMLRKFNEHRRWALRLFLMVSGVWLFRVGLMFWLVVNGGPVGFDRSTFSGPFLTVLSALVYVLSLGVLELYFAAQDRGSSRQRYAMAGLLSLLTIAMAIGVFGATAGLWLPRIQRF